MTAIYVSGTFRCVGVLIAEDWVLTVAHCFHRDVKVKASDVVVQLGRNSKIMFKERLINQAKMRILLGRIC